MGTGAKSGRLRAPADPPGRLLRAPPGGLGAPSPPSGLGLRPRAPHEPVSARRGPLSTLELLLLITIAINSSTIE